MTQWRTGPPMARSIFMQMGDHPSSLDIYVGVMDAPELAQQVVNALNRPPDPPPPPPEPERTLEQELSMVLNRHSAENESNTPDFILAEYLTRCLAAFEITVRKRDEWYGINPHPGWMQDTAPTQST